MSMEQGVRIGILISLIGALLFLLVYVLFLQSTCNNSMEDLIQCVQNEDVQTFTAPPVKEKVNAKKNAPVISSSPPKKDEIQEKIKQTQPKKPAKKPSTTKKTLSAQEELNARRTALEKRLSRKEFKKELDKRMRAIEQAEKRKNQKVPPLERWEPAASVKINFKNIDLGFNYLLGSLFLALPLIAFGLSMGAMSLKPGIQSFGLLTLTAVIAAAITGETVMSNYNFLGLYLFVLGGASLLMPDDQKETVLPFLGLVIGVFVGFTIASDSPLKDRWEFLAGAIIATGFLLLIFAMSARLFNQTWLGYIATTLGAGLIVIALVMFAMEINGKA